MLLPIIFLLTSFSVRLSLESFHKKSNEEGEKAGEGSCKVELGINGALIAKKIVTDKDRDKYHYDFIFPTKYMGNHGFEVTFKGEIFC